eukprot:Nk52_evm3s726 gene=Nk52_evmTU3s726
MVYNSKLSGALLGLAFLACLLMVSSAENIHKHPLKGTASEGGLEESSKELWIKLLEEGSVELGRMVRIGRPPYCSYSFRHENGDTRGKQGGKCLLTLSGNVCVIKLEKHKAHKEGSCPKIKSSKVQVHISEAPGDSRGSHVGYQLHLKSMDIDGFPKESFTSQMMVSEHGVYGSYLVLTNQLNAGVNGYNFVLNRA